MVEIPGVSAGDLFVLLFNREMTLIHANSPTPPFLTSELSDCKYLSLDCQHIDRMSIIMEIILIGSFKSLRYRLSVIKFQAQENSWKIISQIVEH